MPLLSEFMDGVKAWTAELVDVRQIRILVLTSLLVGFLAGCSTKTPPDSAAIQQEALTNVALPSVWKAGGRSGDITDNWLADFNDHQLDTLVREALTNNLDLRISAIRVQTAYHHVELAKAALRPSLSIVGTGGIKAGGSGDPTSPIQGVMFAASWEPDLWGRLRYGRNAAQAQHASAQADLEFARQSMAAATARSWFAATETLLQLRISEEMMKAAQELLHFAEQRQTVGIGSEQEIALARANYSNFEDTSKQLRLAHEQALRALELLLGRYPSAELEARKDLPQLLGTVPVGMPLQMLERRPDLIAAERRVAAAFNRTGEAKAARLPRIILNASAGFISSEVVELKPEFQNPTLGAGARLIAPIYQGGALNAQVRIRTSDQRQAVAEYGRMALRALGDVESALASSQTLAERIPILEQNLADNQRVLEFTQQAYRVGQGDLRAVQQQQLSVHIARQTLLRVQSEQLSQRVNLHLALGGGWEMPQTSTTMNEPGDD